MLVRGQNALAKIQNQANRLVPPSMRSLSSTVFTITSGGGSCGSATFVCGDAPLDAPTVSPKAGMWVFLYNLMSRARKKPVAPQFSVASGAACLKDGVLRGLAQRKMIQIDLCDESDKYGDGSTRNSDGQSGHEVTMRHSSSKDEGCFSLALACLTCDGIPHVDCGHIVGLVRGSATAEQSAAPPALALVERLAALRTLHRHRQLWKALDDLVVQPTTRENARLAAQNERLRQSLRACSLERAGTGCRTFHMPPTLIAKDQCLMIGIPNSMRCVNYLKRKHLKMMTWYRNFVQNCTLVP